MIVKDFRPTGRHTSLEVLLWGDTVLMEQSILCWLRSRFVSGALCACVSACLLLHYCSVCQVRNGKWQIYPEQIQIQLIWSTVCLNVVDNIMLLKDFIRCRWEIWVFKCNLSDIPVSCCYYSMWHTVCSCSCATVMISLSGLRSQ